jgi:hypothetical protein
MLAEFVVHYAATTLNTPRSVVFDAVLYGRA